MSLADFTPDTIEVVVNKTVKLNVRGLTFIDISGLIKVHQHDLGGVFDLYESGAGADMTNVAMGNFAIELVKNAPGLVAHAIALACDEPELANNASRLPLLKQMECLQAIGKLTFEEVGGVKKLIAMVAELATALKPELATQANSKTKPASKKR